MVTEPWQRGTKICDLQPKIHSKSLELTANDSDSQSKVMTDIAFRKVLHKAKIELTAQMYFANFASRDFPNNCTDDHCVQCHDRDK